VASFDEFNKLLSIGLWHGVMLPSNGSVHAFETTREQLSFYRGHHKVNILCKQVHVAVVDLTVGDTVYKNTCLQCDVYSSIQTQMWCGHSEIRKIGSSARGINGTRAWADTERYN
jgi:hypothetical protein